MIKSTLKIVFGTLLFLVVVGVLIGGGETSPTVTQRANQTMKKITDQVAVDSVEKYQIANRNGNKIDICVHAGLVAAAYLQAKDEANYRKWKSVESSDCVRAGLPRN